MGDSSSRHQSGGTNHYRGKSDSLFAAGTQQIEHEQEQEHERTAYFATGSIQGRSVGADLRGFGELIPARIATRSVAGVA
jgi:hypothetical protein